MLTYGTGICPFLAVLETQLGYSAKQYSRCLNLVAFISTWLFVCLRQRNKFNVFKKVRITSSVQSHIKCLAAEDPRSFVSRGTMKERKKEKKPFI